MGYYVVPGNAAANTTAARSNVCLTSAGRREKVCEMVMGAVANPNATDTALTFDLIRVTTNASVGGGTAFTPNPQDPADAACSGVANINLTTESSAVANSTLAFFPINQRNTVRWVAVQESQMHIVSTTTSAGVALRSLAASGGFTASTAATMNFME